MVTVAGFLAEVDDVRRFTDPKQIMKYAGMAVIKFNDSGKHKGNGESQLARMQMAEDDPGSGRNESGQEQAGYPADQPVLHNQGV